MLRRILISAISIGICSTAFAVGKPIPALADAPKGAIETNSDMHECNLTDIESLGFTPEQSKMVWSQMLGEANKLRRTASSKVSAVEPLCHYRAASHSIDFGVRLRQFQGSYTGVNDKKERRIPITLAGYMVTLQPKANDPKQYELVAAAWNRTKKTTRPLTTSQDAKQDNTLSKAEWTGPYSKQTIDLKLK